jgi:hypothetical protein
VEVLPDPAGTGVVAFTRGVSAADVRFDALVDPDWPWATAASVSPATTR